MDGRGSPAQEGSESELVEQLAECIQIRLLRAQQFEIVRHRRGAVDLRELT